MLVFVWLNEFITCLSQFTLSWATERWYFTPSVNVKRKVVFGAIFRAYRDVLRYHLGTLALGAMILAVARPLRIVLGGASQVLSRFGPALGDSFMHACAYLTVAYQDYIEFWDKSAFMDVALTSESF